MWGGMGCLGMRQPHFPKLPWTAPAEGGASPALPSHAGCLDKLPTGACSSVQQLCRAEEPLRSSLQEEAWLCLDSCPAADKAVCSLGHLGSWIPLCLA